jgi:hypothetical protein
MIGVKVLLTHYINLDPYMIWTTIDIWYISSIPGALPILRLFKAFVIDSFVKTIENILSP